MRNTIFSLGLLALIGLSGSAKAQNGTVGSLTWSLSGGTLTVSGNDTMPDFSDYVYSPSNAPPWTIYYTQIDAVVIDNGVTSVGSFAFARAGELISVTIPNSVVSIGDNAFWNCGNVTTVSFGNSLASIGDNAFQNCEKITSVTFPNSVASIGNSAFQECSGLTSVSFGNNLAAIGNLAFYNCYKLNALSFPSSLKSVGNYAFSMCSGIPSVAFPNSVTSIGGSAFLDCAGLTSVNIGSGVASIGGSAFSMCGDLTAINVDGGNAKYSSDGGILYDKLKDTLICCPGGRSGIITIPVSVKKIEDYAFLWCFGFNSITIPDNVITIGEYAFSTCGNLNSVTIGNGVTTIGKNAFYNCGGLTSLTMGNSVVTIGDDAFFSCITLTSVTIPNSTITIGERAFVDCWRLSTLTIGNKVASIGNSAFNGCTDLVRLTIPNSVATIGSSAFSDCWRLLSVELGDGVATIGNNAFSGCSGLTYITSNAASAPSAGANTFASVPATIPVYIPCGALNSYSGATGWKNFTNLIEGKSVSAELCMVSVDDNFHSEIVWKSEPDVAYKVYREGTQSGQYDLAATIDANSPNIWVDMASNAKNSSYRYKVSAMNDCGNEFDGVPHKTIYLTIKEGQNNSWGLTWTAYGGRTYTSYNIYRSSGDTPGNWELIWNLPNSDTSYTDLAAPSSGYVYYRIEIALNEPCADAKNAIKSNIATNNPNLGISNYELGIGDYAIYPNPTTGKITIRNEESGMSSEIEVFDVVGRKLLSYTPLTSHSSPLIEIDISHLANGLYFLKIDNKMVKVVKQ
ncbi:MAG: leucine-rich repeat protein [Lentimicrobiaceae bacterium]|nr:leucine-rich repeat protein [Lentimicrobiaceae bacterium]